MGADEEAREKRRFDRIPAQHMVCFAQLQGGMPKEPMSGLGRTLDVCAGGARLETDRTLSVGEHLQLEIAVGSQIVHVDATVVHVATSASEMVAAGLSFDRVPPPDRATLSALGFRHQPVGG
jgi:PilZ domain